MLANFCHLLLPIGVPNKKWNLTQKNVNQMFKTFVKNKNKIKSNDLKPKKEGYKN